MGDFRRNKLFASFIFRNFPPKKFKRVLVVADGKGELAKILSKKYKVRVIEDKPRQKRENLRRFVKYCRGWFDVSVEVAEDFIVGMHPDEATSQIIRSGNKYNKRWAVVPCCIKGIDAHGVKTFEGWINKLKSLSNRKTRTTILPMNGKNLVLWSM